MNILIVSGSYFPQKSPRSFRTTELAREFANLGHNVSVIIPIADYNGNEEKNKYNVNLIYYTKPQKTITQFISTVPLIGNKLNRILEWAFVLPGILSIKKINQELEKLRDNTYDLLISVAYPHINHWAVNKFLKKNPKFTKLWIADCGDPFMGATMNKIKNPFWFKYVEKSWCKRANYITVPIEGAKNGYYPEFHEKIKVIPQGFRMDKIILPKYIKNKVPTFIYSGGVGLGQRNPLPLIDLLEQEDIEYKAIFYTNNHSFFADHINNPHVELREYVSRESLIRELAKADFLLNLDNGTTRQWPSKLIDYTIARRPILNIDVKNLNYELILNFIEGNYSGSLKVLSPEHYDIKVISKKFLELGYNGN